MSSESGADGPGKELVPFYSDKESISIIKPARELALRDTPLQRVTATIDRPAMQKEREESGCVMRALKTAFEAEPTDEEWEVRMGQKRGQDNSLLERILRTTGQSTFNVQELLDEENTRIAGLITDFSSHTTPLGIEMSKYTFTQEELTSDEIVKRIIDGNKVCVTGMGSSAYHMAYVGLDDSGKLKSRSDKGEILKFTDNLKINSFVFTPKEV